MEPKNKRRGYDFFQAEYNDARMDLRLALINIGHKTSSSCVDMFFSVLWKSSCHILYQLGLWPILKSISDSVLPCSISTKDNRAGQEFAAQLVAHAYEDLHEITLKGE